MTDLPTAREALSEIARLNRELLAHRARVEQLGEALTTIAFDKRCRDLRGTAERALARPEGGVKPREDLSESGLLDLRAQFDGVSPMDSVVIDVGVVQSLTENGLAGAQKGPNLRLPRCPMTNKLTDEQLREWRKRMVIDDFKFAIDELIAFRASMAHDLTDEQLSLLPKESLVSAYIALRARVAQFQRERAELSDRLNGTPCAEIRWQHEREELIGDRDALRARVAELEAALTKARQFVERGYGDEDAVIEAINAVLARPAESGAKPRVSDRTENWDFEQAKRRTIEQTEDGRFVARDRVPPQPASAAKSDEDAARELANAWISKEDAGLIAFEGAVKAFAAFRTQARAEAEARIGEMDALLTDAYHEEAKAKAERDLLKRRLAGAIEAMRWCANHINQEWAERARATLRALDAQTEDSPK